MSRPATREALCALDAEMVPDRLRTGPTFRGAARSGRAPAPGGERVRAARLVVLVTDGALPDADGAALDAALGATPGLALAARRVRRAPRRRRPAPAPATRALRRLAAAHGGVVRELAANEVGETLPAALGALARGGDVAEVRLVADGAEHVLASRLAPGEGRQPCCSLASLGPAALVGTAGGARSGSPSARAPSTPPG